MIDAAYYRQVKNPNPAFKPEADKDTLSFCRKLMSKAENFSSSFDFAIYVAFARSNGWRKRLPPKLRRKAIDALLQALCFHYDPLANRVNASITTMAIECGLATESKAGNLSITRATRALKFLAHELKLLTYDTEYDADIGCNIPTDITFTPALFAALDVSDVAVAAARRSSAEWTNKQRAARGQPRLEIDELISQAWRFVRERFRQYQREHKAHGIKRARAKRDSGRKRIEIENVVKQQLTREISTGRFSGDRNEVMAEVKRRVRERMIMSRNQNYTRLGSPSPAT